MLALWAAIIVWRWQQTDSAESNQPVSTSPANSAVFSSTDLDPDDRVLTGPADSTGSPAAGEFNYNDFMHGVSKAVLDGRPRLALGQVYAARTATGVEAYRGALAGLEQFLREVCQMSSLLEAAFREKVGETVLLTHNNRKYQVLLQATAGGRVRGLVGDEPVVFEISQLNPLELSYWLGSPATAAQCAMKAGLHVRGKDIEGARIFAGRAGPLTEAMRKILDTSEEKSDPSV